MEEYGFRDVGETCVVCHKAFEEEEDLFSGLSRHDDKFERLDFCTTCWQSADQGTVFCFWKRKPRLRESQPTVDGNVVFDIFQRLEGSGERHDQNFRYILALLLMRRKRLKFLDVERTEHGEFLVLEDRQLDDVKYRLLDPGMTEEEMQRAKDEVDKLFSVNVDKEESAQEEKADAGSAADSGEAPPGDAETAGNDASLENEGPASSEEVAMAEEPAEDKPADPAESVSTGGPVRSEEANDGQSVSEVHKS